MKRTSFAQFELMVDFMEKHGDLSRPSDGHNGRMNTIFRWDELTNILNAEASGDFKSVEKWRKVWSDLKNNTKRKASKVRHAAKVSGSGVRAKLTDFELRVINIANSQTSGIPEVILEEILPEVAGEERPDILNTTQCSEDAQHVEDSKKRPFEFFQFNQTASEEENSDEINFRIKQCKTAEEEGEYNSLRIQKEKLLILKEEIAVKREEELFKFEKEKHRLELLKLKLEIELLIDK